MWTQRFAMGIVSVAVLSGCAVMEAYGSDGENTVRVSTDQGRIVITDTDSGRVLYDQRNQRLYNNRNDPQLIIPEVEVVARPAGMDLVFTYTNDESVSRPLADMLVGPLVMPDNLTFQDTQMLGGQDREISPEHRPSIAYTYPDNTYAPVYVLRDQEQAVGVSALYPLFEYKHDVQFRLRQAPPVDEGYRGWMLNIRISRLPDDESGRGRLDYSATLEPGQSQSYTITVRYDRNPEEWVRTLVPYRDYFRELYGGVHYQRRTQPALVYSTGEASQLSASNPFGYRSERLRPDVHGFGPMVDSIMEPSGWPEVLLYKPTGQYYQHRQWNYPFLVLSNLETTEEFRTAFDRQIGLASIPARGRNLSIWWGRSLQLATQWDPAECFPFDPRDASHRAAAYAELNLAQQMGVTAMGLDTYTHDLLPVWDSYAWLRDMADAYPQIHFFTEPLACDVLHSLAPTWMRGWNEGDKVQQPEDIYRIKGPNMLADFLLPGHETVLPMRYQAFEDKFGITPTPERVNADTARFASWGYRPVMFTEFSLESDLHADESWLRSIPGDLQIPPSKWLSRVDPYDGAGGFTDGDNGSSVGDGAEDGTDRRFSDVELGSGVVSLEVESAGGSNKYDRGSSGKPAFEYDPRTDRLSIGAPTGASSSGVIRVIRQSSRQTLPIRYDPKTDRVSKPSAIFESSDQQKTSKN